MKKKQSKKKQRDVSAALDRQRVLTERVARAMQTRWRLSTKKAGELGFHMTDWIADLEALHDLMAKERWNNRNAERIITSFLVHVPWHVTQAQKIMFREKSEDLG